jgi:hypothetical protein
LQASSQEKIFYRDSNFQRFENSSILIIFIKSKDHDDSRCSLQVLESLFKFVHEAEGYVSISLLIRLINIKEITTVIITPSTKLSIFINSNVTFAVSQASWATLNPAGMNVAFMVSMRFDILSILEAHFSILL